MGHRHAGAELQLMSKYGMPLMYPECAETPRGAGMKPGRDPSHCPAHAPIGVEMLAGLAGDLSAR